MNKIINNILTFLIVIVIGVATIYILSLISPNNKPQTATAPSVELPPNTATTTNQQQSLIDLPLNTHPYTPTKDVLSNNAAYNSQSIRLILDGSFGVARLHIQGTVTEPGNHFLNIVYGNTGGTLYGSRLSAGTLNLTQTQQNGGVFTSQNPIDVDLDLLNPIPFATTRAEYEKNKQTSQLINLWEANLLPPTYISLLVAPFNAGGVYGGAQITSTFEYSCSLGSHCLAALCPAGELTTVCMRNEFGTAVAKDWCKRAGYTNCSF